MEHKWYVVAAEFNSYSGVALKHEGCAYESPNVSMWTVMELHEAIAYHIREWHSQ